MRGADGIRDLLLRAIVLLGIAIFAITESLGIFDAIRRLPLLLAWGVVLALGI